MKTYFFSEGGIGRGILLSSPRNGREDWKLRLGAVSVETDHESPPMVTPCELGGPLGFGLMTEASLVSDGSGLMFTAPRDHGRDQALVLIEASGGYGGDWMTLAGDTWTAVKTFFRHGRFLGRSDIGLVIMDPGSVIWVRHRRNDRTRRAWVIRYDDPDTGPSIEETETSIRTVKARYQK